MADIGGKGLAERAFLQVVGYLDIFGHTVNLIVKGGVVYISVVLTLRRSLPGYFGNQVILSEGKVFDSYGIVIANIFIKIVHRTVTLAVLYNHRDIAVPLFSGERHCDLAPGRLCSFEKDFSVKSYGYIKISAERRSVACLVGKGERDDAICRSGSGIFKLEVGNGSRGFRKG